MSDMINFEYTSTSCVLNYLPDDDREALRPPSIPEPPGTTWSLVGPVTITVLPASNRTNYRIPILFVWTWQSPRRQPIEQARAIMERRELYLKLQQERYK